MKFKKISLFLILIVFVIPGIYISDVYGHRNSAPTFECASCHDGELVTDMVRIDGLPKSYMKGQTYNLTVVVTSDLESMSECKGGFAVEATAGTIKVKDKKHTQLSNGFLTHTQEGSELRKWSFAWTAPKDRTDVSITVMAVSANGDYSSAGDKIGATSYLLKPAK